jgi:spore germination protein
MTSTVEPIGPLQFFFFLTMSMVTGGVFIWPEAVLSTAGNNALWAITGSIMLALATTAALFVWMSLTGPGIFVDRLHQTWGFLAWPWILSFSLLRVVLDAALVTLFSQMLSTIFYPLTPLWVLKLIILAEAAWFGGRRLTILSRNIQFWFPVLAFSFFLLASLAFGNVQSWWALRPSSHVVLTPLTQAVIGTWFLWAQTDVLLTISHFMRPARAGLVRKLTVAAILFHSVVIVVIYMITVGALGPEAVMTLRWPLVYVLSNLSSHTFYLSRPGLIILLTWTGGMVFFSASHLFCLGMNLSQLAARSFRWTPQISWGAATVEFGGSFLLPSAAVASHVVLNVFDPLSLVLVSILLTVSIVIRLFMNRQRIRKNTTF